MNNNQRFAAFSLELHLFFARIMKEHSLFLMAGFLPPNADLACEADALMRRFERILARALQLSSGVVRCPVLDSGEIVTKFTDCAEQQTQRLTGVRINQELTEQALCLRSVDNWTCRCPLSQIRQLNREALQQVDRLIDFKERLLRQMKACTIFTGNYPLLVEHILREARLYRSYLLHLEKGRGVPLQNLRSSELFWNRIMMEHALFIRGLLDPTEEELIAAANGFAGDFRTLLSESRSANDRTMERCEEALELTRKFRDFKTAGVQGIENCQICSLILPLLADHVLREANHYIRLLEA